MLQQSGITMLCFFKLSVVRSLPFMVIHIKKPIQGGDLALYIACQGKDKSPPDCKAQ